ncbi:nitroreductase family protein [Tuberibacillus sp. Marseille-P3662]|uniref:nitroreductase family protein n=1 Tax=Tuberibacillus sp. Marseille-P3662 TaxID=1965358 RepID=UPI000A1CAA24|nr:nitroreductase family protein [Tuberibacillus sp. Marseille-P3662]
MTHKLANDVTDIREPQYNIDDIFYNRWSPRSFSEEEVPNDVLLSLFEAARWAPSAANFQPWHFIIARAQEDREKFYPFIFDGNRDWCERAPVLAVILSKTTTDNGHNRSHAFDTGAAWAHLALQAFNKGLITHAMGGFNPDKAREVLNIPDDYDIQCVVAIGYRGEKALLSEKDQNREKPSFRHSIDEFLFEGDFQQGLK